MNYILKKSLPKEGIFWKLSPSQQEYLIKILKSQHGLKGGIKQGDGPDCNIAWYLSGYYNYIKNKTSLPTYRWSEYFEENIYTPQIFN